VQSRRDADILLASTAAVRRLIDTDARASVDDLAAAAGISRRTWHRYFPAKEDCIRPMMQDAIATMFSAMHARPRDEDVCDSFIAAFSATAAGLFAARTRGLMPIIIASTSLSAVWDHESALTAISLRRIVADRLGCDAAAPRVAALASTLVALSNSALRDSTESTRDPVELLTERIEALGLASTPRSSMTAAEGRWRTS
jgi:AcrR family transcriptional regulator